MDCAPSSRSWASNTLRRARTKPGWGRAPREKERIMGEIVAAVGTCHTPYMFTRPPDENPQQLDQAGASMQELGKVLDETKPDAILFFGSDHVETFSVTCVPSFAIIA